MASEPPAADSWKTIIEPFRVKAVEPLGFTNRAERRRLLIGAHYNLFNIPAEKVLIDLLTDSGACAMSSEQWGAMMRGDTSYAGSRSFYLFQRAVRELTGYRHVLPVHQGRAGERILFSFIGGKGKTIVSNTHFDTTRANVEASGAAALDLPVDCAWDFEKPLPFKGNMDPARLEAVLRERGPSQVPLVLMTATNNSLGGQPVSMSNLRQVSRICARHKIPLFLDAARFAENAYLIKTREEGYSRRSARDIAREMFSYASGCLMSGKKDALVNMGGFLALNDPAWARRARELLILGEGFPTYGGLSGRDLEAMALGLEEVLDERYLEYRIRSVAYLAAGLRKKGIPVLQPSGGHAVYVDAKRFLSHLPPEQYPAQALVCALYLEAGIRTCGIGSLMFGKKENGKFIPSRMELLRLAVPRRVYTQSHIDLVVEAFGMLAAKRRSIPGLRLLEAPEYLGHFSAKLAPAAAAAGRRDLAPA